MGPHAGWLYSGSIAARAFASLRSDADTVVVAGGHLPAGMPPLLAGEDGVETPLGPLEIDGEFRDILRRKLGDIPDNYRDNTVEVQLPMVKYFFPHSRLVWLRLPAEIRSFESGRIIADVGETLRRNFVMFASTDLTHYGDNYGFSPQGRGSGALEWVRAVNDAAFIRAVAAGDPHEVLRRAEEDGSACSAGAVLACLAFAQSRNAAPARLLDYGTSADSTGPGVPDSFVGYAAMAWDGVYLK
jgi:AmmeMemoRadiSam system protein B